MRQICTNIHLLLITFLSFSGMIGSEKSSAAQSTDVEITIANKLVGIKPTFYELFTIPLRTDGQPEYSQQKKAPVIKQSDYAVTFKAPANQPYKIETIVNNKSIVSRVFAAPLTNQTFYVLEEIDGHYLLMNKKDIRGIKVTNKSPLISTGDAYKSDIITVTLSQPQQFKPTTFRLGTDQSAYFFISPHFKNVNFRTFTLTVPNKTNAQKAREITFDNITDREIKINRSQGPLSTVHDEFDYKFEY